MPNETELKLRIAPEHASDFAQLPLLQTATQYEPKSLYNTYFDTPRHDFLQARIGLRVRHIGNQRIQTLKTAGKGCGGLHQRQEWETIIESDTPDYSVLPQKVLPKWCRNKNKLQSIQPVFTTDFIRTQWDVSCDDGSLVEVVLDQGEVRTDDHRLPLHEVELELKSGSPVKLYQLALDFQRSIPLTLENHSKAARGYGLHYSQPLQYQKAGSVGLDIDLTAEQGFEQICWHCIAHLQANEDMVLYGRDVEGVHQMRVALRRLRSALSLYKSLIPAETNKWIRDEIKWISSVLGEARDWDVFMLTLQSAQKVSSHQPEQLDPVLKKVKALQKHAYINVREAMRSPRYTCLLLTLGQWLTAQTWRESLDKKMRTKLEQPIQAFTSKVLQKQYERICKKGRHLIRMQPEARHEVRIMVKKLSYGIRFFSELYPSRTTKPFIKSLSVLQDGLGILNDISVSEQLITQLELADDEPARYFLAGWYAHLYQTHLTEIAEVWDDFTKQETFW
ncbi:CHAD domain-containing protein [Candidatus Albibeggiatoa sp. nov. NOAA]|uniref:CYTH and CHAD domain-containing protein n=1 Tax=Candidatus Albibeggiatoa sp. nov. NOAA TaxID=3162724 RepID=UPI0032F6D4A8|nr:CHAD domain-containing protein [Thiotrichaceae bacterium]